MNISFLFIFCILSVSASCQQFFSNVSLEIGARHNRSRGYEFTPSAMINGEEYHIRYYTFKRDWQPYFALNTSFYKQHFKKDSSISFSLRTGISYFQVERDHSFAWLAGNDRWYIYSYEDELYYTTKTSNLGFDLGIVFSKLFKEKYTYEVGFIYRGDYSFVHSTHYHKVPHDSTQWNTIQYPQKHRFRNKINHDVYFYYGHHFSINKNYSLGFNFVLPIFNIGQIIGWNLRYPIPGHENNFWNRNNFFGFTARYNFDAK